MGERGALHSLQQMCPLEQVALAAELEPVGFEGGHMRRLHERERCLSLGTSVCPPGP